MTPEQKATYQHLVDAGLWHEAYGFKEERRRELREQGISRREAHSRAWEEMRQKYVPNTGEPQEPLATRQGASDADPAQIASGGDVGDSGAADASPVVSGTGADFVGDVAWVYANYARVVSCRPGKPPRCDFSKADSPPPSAGAVGLMEWAAENRTAFFKDLVPKAIRSAETADEEIRREERSIAEIREVLKRYLELVPG